VVLTAAHALRQASKVRVRFDAAQPGEWIAPDTHIVEFPEIDIAVLSIDPHDHSQVEPVPEKSWKPVTWQVRDIEAYAKPGFSHASSQVRDLRKGSFA
jgi:hypothetical protein